MTRFLALGSFRHSILVYVPIITHILSIYAGINLQTMRGVFQAIIVYLAVGIYHAIPIEEERKLLSPSLICLEI